MSRPSNVTHSDLRGPPEVNLGIRLQQVGTCHNVFNKLIDTQSKGLSVYSYEYHDLNNLKKTRNLFWPASKLYINNSSMTTEPYKENLEWAPSKIIFIIILFVGCLQRLVS